MSNTFEMLESRVQAGEDSTDGSSRLLEDAYSVNRVSQTGSSKSWVDRNFEICSEQAVGTPDMVGCANAARSNWDGIMNDAYKTLQLNQTKEQRDALINSQRQWCKFRDADFESINTFADDERLGSIATVHAANEKMEIVKLRAIEIENRDGNTQNGSPYTRGVTEHAIDKKLNDGKEGMLYIDKLGRAYDDWDAQLNATYKLLINSDSMSQEQIAALKKAEREWIKYRDLEFDLLDKTFDQRYNGNRIESMQGKVDILRQRALQLEHRFNTASGG